MALVFALVLIASSIDVINKYFGLPAMGIYAIVVIAAVFAANSFGRQILSAFSERTATVLMIVTFAALVIITFTIYPIANSGRLGGGSDADDALLVGATELLAGRYPFYPTTYLGNQIAPLPGSVILAVPFVLIGLLPLQNIFWLFIFLAILRHEMKSGKTSLALLWLVLILSPAVMQNLVTATDRTSNTIYIITAMWVMIRTIPFEGVSVWKKLAGPVLLGIGLSSRSNFAFVIPLIFSVLVQNSSWREAVKYCALSGGVALLVTVPFWLFDPAGFTPFHTQADKVILYESILPYATLIVPASGMLLASALAFRHMALDGAAFFWSCAITQIFSVFFLSTLSSIHLGQMDLYLGHVSYGVFFLFFAVLAVAITLRPKDGSVAELSQ